MNSDITKLLATHDEAIVKRAMELYMCRKPWLGQIGVEKTPALTYGCKLWPHDFFNYLLCGDKVAAHCLELAELQAKLVESAI